MVKFFTAPQTKLDIMIDKEVMDDLLLIAEHTGLKVDVMVENVMKEWAIASRTQMWKVKRAGVRLAKMVEEI